MHDLLHLSTRKEWQAPDLAAGRSDLLRQGQGISFCLTTSTVSIIAFAGLVIRDVWIVFIRKQSASAIGAESLWLCLVGSLIKTSS